MLNGETKPGVHPKPVVAARPFRLPTIDAMQPRYRKHEITEFVVSEV